MNIGNLVFEYEGELAIDEDATLNNPEFRAIGGRFNFATGLGYLMVHFKERDGVYEHAREYSFPLPENGITAGDLSLVLSANPILALFTLRQ